ncbi:hypothetical protein Tco_1242325 [Tanacetum coccineum]
MGKKSYHENLHKRLAKLSSGVVVLKILDWEATMKQKYHTKDLGLGGDYEAKIEALHKMNDSECGKGLTLLGDKVRSVYHWRYIKGV